MFKTNDGKRFCIATTRFNLKTLKENREYLKKLNNLYENSNDGRHCVYGSPSIMDDSISPHIPIFVIEMLNVSQRHHLYPGKIVGIGIIRNRTIDESYRIYSKHNYNRHIYLGANRISVSKDALNEHEQSLIRRMEFALFYGSRHHKRSDGITKLPQYILDAFPSFAAFLIERVKQKEDKTNINTISYENIIKTKQIKVTQQNGL